MNFVFKNWQMLTGLATLLIGIGVMLSSYRELPEIKIQATSAILKNAEQDLTIAVLRADHNHLVIQLEKIDKKLDKLLERR
jgi:hypothetical protein